MESFLMYIAKASIGILLFYLFYYLVLRKETFYVSNRLYLLFGLIVAVLLPAFPVSYEAPVAFVNNADFFSLSETPITEFSNSNMNKTESLFFWNNPVLVISTIYLIGAGFFLLRLVLQTAFVRIQLLHGKKVLLRPR